MLRFHCYMCKKEIGPEPGALLFAPPELIENGDESFYTSLVQKFHICVDCYLDLITWIKMEK